MMSRNTGLEPTFPPPLSGKHKHCLGTMSEDGITNVRNPNIALSFRTTEATRGSSICMTTRALQARFFIPTRTVNCPQKPVINMGKGTTERKDMRNSRIRHVEKKRNLLTSTFLFLNGEITSSYHDFIIILYCKLTKC